MEIKSFLQWFNEKTTGTYAAFRFDDNSNKKIIKLCEALNLKNPIKEDDIHCTVLYSRKFLPDLKVGTYNDFDEQECPASKLHLFGNTLVLLLDSDFCKEKHAQLMDKYKASYDYDEYIPHVSIGYEVDEIPNIPFVKLQLTINELYVEDLNLNWADRYIDDK